MLKLVEIKKEYVVADNTVQALKGINLEFRQNEFVSVLGQSGCGKTTLLNIIGGLDKYTSGDLIIENVSTKTFKDADWDAYRNHKIGFVFQSYNLISHLNVLNNVELALTISGVSASERKQRAVDALTKVGLQDHLNKMPNQLSGGQMQRVAIARAIINNPEILLADEPTGALDTATSIQIMDIIKEISKEKLVIMVTHNPDLAQKYSTRIVKLLDGKVVEDSNPYVSKNEVKPNNKEAKSNDEVIEKFENNETVDAQNNDKKQEKIRKKKNKKNLPFSKTSMSFFTALSLSFKNLLSKKGRTLLVSLASSIGIIGVTLVLALSNGFNSYISKLQSDMLSTYPLTVSGASVDYDNLMSLFENSDLEKYPNIQEVIIDKVVEKLESGFSSGSDINQDFIDKAINTLDSSLYYDIVMETGQYLHVYTQDSLTNNYKYIDINNSNSMLSALGGDTQWQILLDNQDFVLTQYEVIYGQYPTSSNELVLFVDEYNQLADTIITSLGLDSTSDTINFNDIIGKKFYIIPNDVYYTQSSLANATLFTQMENSISEEEFDTSKGIEVSISAILRPRSDTQNMLYSSGIAYPKALLNILLEQNMDSQIVNFAKENATINPLTGSTYDTSTTTTIEDAYDEMLRQLGGIDLPNYISIYPVDFESKNAIKAHIDEYNSTLSPEEQVHYNDIMELFMSSLTTLVDIISYVLIAFSAISLIVSSIMIAVITYVSVIERTKEIGILRSIGARKRDISRVFNAETFIIGLLSGLIGVIVSWILTIPINLIISSLAENIGSLAVLSPLTALIMVLISVAITMLAGLIPSKMAAKKDPITCLRVE